MRANEFVKKFGLDLAKRDIAALDSGFIKRNDFFEHYGFDILDDLKRLVESYELVGAFGGLDLAKKVLNKLPNKYQSYTITRDDTGETTQSFKLQQAIADVESCQ